MNYKAQSDKKHIFENSSFANTIKKQQSPIPTKLSVSAYDRIVQLVTHDNPEVKPQQEEQKQNI